MESAAVITEPAHRRGRKSAPRPDAERVAAARARFAAEGKTVASWAAERGHDAQLVHKVLGGRRACTSGESHKIAVALGIKDDAA